ncbi:hypothetical protein RN001_005137 [Aquatica leii]|uniref:Uncharacterized protein n=1 Tax=Aquatica leii TaxID=1421715 RepID=A0AAN7SPS1_9COLE|nr:hypothetical protein RN001_005137 [Aquatica leii]
MQNGRNAKNSKMEFKLDVDRLLRDELEYELQIRRIDYSGNVEKLRKTLRSALALEKSGNVFSQIIQLDAKTEITICEQKLKELKDIFFTTESSTWPIKKIQCKLAHIFGRVDRISSSEESLLSKRSELVNLIMEFISEFSSKVAYTEEHDVQLPNFPEFFNEQSKEVENSDSDNKLPTVSSLVSSTYKKRKALNPPELDKDALTSNKNPLITGQSTFIISTKPIIRNPYQDEIIQFKEKVAEKITNIIFDCLKSASLEQNTIANVNNLEIKTRIEKCLQNISYNNNHNGERIE